MIIEFPGGALPVREFFSLRTLRIIAIFGQIRRRGGIEAAWEKFVCANGEFFVILHTKSSLYCV
mgnify:CR=1 FL=1